ncbi:MAG: sel1 repeat family protein [Lentisphaeria bacterium]|nr:sel1 repeat family protein [Lentisphaeria bacterium]
MNDITNQTAKKRNATLISLIIWIFSVAVNGIILWNMTFSNFIIDKVIEIDKKIAERERLEAEERQKNINNPPPPEIVEKTTPPEPQVQQQPVRQNTPKTPKYKISVPAVPKFKNMQELNNFGTEIKPDPAIIAKGADACKKAGDDNFQSNPQLAAYYYLKFLQVKKDADVLFNLGRIYEKNNLFGDALKYYALSAKHGNEKGAFNSATLLVLHKAFFINRQHFVYADAIPYAEIALKSKDKLIAGNGANVLGYIFMNGGYGVQENLEKAFQYFTFAESCGIPQAKGNLEQLAKKMRRW